MFLNAGGGTPLQSLRGGNDGRSADGLVSRGVVLRGERARLSGACVPCAAGYVKAPGDDPSAGETRVLRVRGGLSCFFRDVRRAPWGPSTLVGTSRRARTRSVGRGVPEEPPRLRRLVRAVRRGVRNSRRDGTAGGDTTCGECTKHYHVSSGACVACPRVPQRRGRRRDRPGHDVRRDRSHAGVHYPPGPQERRRGVRGPVRRGDVLGRQSAHELVRGI